MVAAEQQAEEEIRRAFDENPDDIAAIIIEPIQAEGGDNHFRPGFLQSVQRIAREQECLFIVDEVQTGVGLTGRFWAHEHFGLEPDALAFGKKTQVCGCLVGPRVDEEPDNVFKASSRINSTFGGGLTDMVRCGRFLEIIAEEGARRERPYRWASTCSPASGHWNGEFGGLVTNCPRASAS